MLFSGLQTFKNTPGAVLSICTCKHLGNTSIHFPKSERKKKKHFPKHSCNFNFHNPNVCKYSSLIKKPMPRVFSNQGALCSHANRKFTFHQQKSRIILKKYTLHQ